MKIEHIAIWVEDIEGMRDFYLTYFEVTCGEKYFNAKNNYTSYFLTFAGGSSRIELMHRPDIAETLGKRAFSMGLPNSSTAVI